jgi:hypothetical protein
MRTNTRIVVRKLARTDTSMFAVKKVTFSDGHYNKSYAEMVGTLLDEKELRNISENRFNQVQIEATE